MLNPYIAGAPVVEASMFFGREDVFSWIERSLEGKFVNNILVLHGQRRVGKTSVLKQIPNFLPNKYIQVFYDLQGRTGTTLDRFLWWLASEITRTLKRENDIIIPKPDRKAFEDTEYLFNVFLPSVRSALGDYVLLLTFDEFDSLDQSEIQETLSRPLIAYLRRLIESDWLNFIFSIGSSGDKLENMQASYTDFFKSALYRKISFLTSDEIQRLVTKPVEGLIQYENEAVHRIGEITSGHPYFTQLMCHELFSHCQKTGARIISVADVEAVLEDVVERGTVNLKFVWDEASDLEKWILATLAQMDSGDNQKIAQALTEQRVRFSEPDLNSALIHLRDKDVLRDDNRFVIHLMRLWLVANRPIDRVREELEEVNPIANRFIEIGDEYRDRGEAEQAIEYYQQALNMNPGDLKAQNNIASVYLEQKNFIEAVRAFESALKMDSEDVTARTGYCEASLALGEQAQGRKDYESAIHYYQQVLEITPNHIEAKERSTKLQKLANDYEEAQQAIREKRYERAVELLQGIIVVDPTYKMTTRLLTEAVEARKTAPLWSRPWLLPATLALAFVVLGIFLGPKAWSAISTPVSNTKAGTTELPVSVASTSTLGVIANNNITDTSTSKPTSAAPSIAQLAEEFAIPILAAIEGREPDVQDNFNVDPTDESNWEFRDGETKGEIEIENGVLLVHMFVKGNDDIFNKKMNDKMNFNNFVLKVDIDLTDLGTGHVMFNSRNNEKDENVSFEFDPAASDFSDKWSVGLYSSTGSINLAGGETIYTGKVTVTIISNGSEYAVFINEIPRTYIYDTGQSPSKNGKEIDFKLYSDPESTVRFDNLKIWNLDGMEFSTAPTTATPTITPIPAWVMDFVEPRLERIKNVNPDFTEEFSTPQSGWEVIVGAEGSFQIEAGAARVNVKREERSAIIQETVNSLTSGDFILEMDARVVEGEAAEELWIHFIPSDNPSDSQNLGFLAQPAESTWSVTIDSPEGRSFQQGKRNISPVGQYTQITIILAEQKVAFLLNGNSVAYLQDPYLEEPAPGFQFICDGRSTGGICEFDNIKIWTLP